jgi:hypothetical protein
MLLTRKQANMSGTVTAGYEYYSLQCTTHAGGMAGWKVNGSGNGWRAESCASYATAMAWLVTTPLDGGASDLLGPPI